MIRLIAIDLDGTLLRDNHQISDNAKEIIKKAVDSSIYVIISTGRPYRAAKLFQKELNINQPMIMHNGAILKKMHGELTYFKPISVESSKVFLEYCNKKGYICSIIYGDCDEIYMNKYDEFTIGIHVNYHFKEPIICRNTEVVFDKKHNPITKILITDENSDNITKINEDLLKKFKNMFNISRSGNCYIDIAHRDISKGAALKYIANILKVSPEYILAIGDSRNDLEMLQFAKISVAMGNSEDFVKQRVSYITLSNNDDGVYEAIRKFI